MRTGTIAFIAGVALYHVLAWPMGLATALLLPLSVFLGIKYRPIRLICLCCSGFIWCGVIAEYQLAQQLPGELQATELVIQGKISSTVQTQSKSLRFQFHVTEAWRQGQAVSFTGKVLLGWYQHSIMPRPGQIWRFRVKMKKPRNTRISRI